MLQDPAIKQLLMQDQDDSSLQEQDSQEIKSPVYEPQSPVLKQNSNNNNNTKEEEEYDPVDNFQLLQNGTRILAIPREQQQPQQPPKKRLKIMDVTALVQQQHKPPEKKSDALDG